MTPGEQVVFYFASKSAPFRWLNTINIIRIHQDTKESAFAFALRRNHDDDDERAIVCLRFVL